MLFTFPELRVLYSIWSPLLASFWAYCFFSYTVIEMSIYLRVYTHILPKYLTTIQMR